MHSATLSVDPFILQALGRRLTKGQARLLNLLWSICFVIALLSAWNIGPQSYLFYLTEALPFTPRAVLMTMAVLLGALGTFVWVDAARELRAKASNTLLLVGVVLVVGKGLLFLVANDAVRTRQYVNSPVASLIHISADYSTRQSEASLLAIPTHTFYDFIRGRDDSAPKILMMLIESWAETPGSLAQIAKQVDHGKFHLMASGFTEYHGATLSGEYRELCGRFIIPTSELSRSTDGLRCLPLLLRDRGYETYGLHGYNREFYARAALWSRFGFQHELFRNEFAGAHECPGPFRGVCDTDLIQRGVSILDGDRDRRFVYLLTLSSHEPLSSGLRLPVSRYFRDIPATHTTQLITRHALSDLMVALVTAPTAQCTWVYVSGDHQPPSAALQTDLFEPGVVPYLAFAVNCGGKAS